MTPKLRLSILVGGLVLLIGCATPQSFAPVAEYLPKGAPLAFVKEELIDVYRKDVWKLERESDQMVSFLKQNNETAPQYLTGSNFDVRVFTRETVTITDTGDSVVLRASDEVINNYGSAFEERRTVRTDKHTVDRLLRVNTAVRDRMKAQAEKQESQ